MTDNEKVLEKHIIGENGISYTLGEDGLYYPDLELPEGTHYEIGKYGLINAVGVFDKPPQRGVHQTTCGRETE